MPIRNSPADRLRSNWSYFKWIFFFHLLCLISYGSSNYWERSPKLYCSNVAEFNANNAQRASQKMQRKRQVPFVFFKCNGFQDTCCPKSMRWWIIFIHLSSLYCSIRYAYYKESLRTCHILHWCVALPVSPLYNRVRKEYAEQFLCRLWCEDMLSSRLHCRIQNSSWDVWVLLREVSWRN